MSRVLSPFILLLTAIPVALLLKVMGVTGVPLFAIALIAIIPLAKYIGRATEEITLQTNDTLGGLLNATFGNAIELTIAILALRRGLLELVRASIIGSILSNLLLLIGVSMLIGGLRYKQQSFNRSAAGVSSTMLIIAITGLAVPTIFALTSAQDAFEVNTLSIIVSCVLAAVYIGGLIFAFKTHKHLFDTKDELAAAHFKPTWSLRKASLVLGTMLFFAAIMSEFLVESIGPVVATLGLSQTFIGAILIPIITNLAEKASSIHYALRNKINLSIEIGTSSATQIALFVVPVLVLVSASLAGHLALIFTPFQLIAMLLAVMIINYLSADGVCNWLEGVQLMAVYAIIAIAFFFV